MARAVPVLVQAANCPGRLSGKPTRRETSAPLSQRIWNIPCIAFCPRSPKPHSRRAFVQTGRFGLTARTAYSVAWGSRLQSTALKALLASRSWVSKRAAIFDALLKHPASFMSRA